MVTLEGRTIHAKSLLRLYLDKFDFIVLFVLTILIIKEPRQEVGILVWWYVVNIILCTGRTGSRQESQNQHLGCTFSMTT